MINRGRLSSCPDHAIYTRTRVKSPPRLRRASSSCPDDGNPIYRFIIQGVPGWIARDERRKKKRKKRRSPPLEEKIDLYLIAVPSRRKMYPSSFFLPRARFVSNRKKESLKGRLFKSQSNRLSTSELTGQINRANTSRKRGRGRGWIGRLIDHRVSTLNAIRAKINNWFSASSDSRRKNSSSFRWILLLSLVLSLNDEGAPAQLTRHLLRLKSIRFWTSIETAVSNGRNERKRSIDRE